MIWGVYRSVTMLLLQAPVSCEFLLFPILTALQASDQVPAKRPYSEVEAQDQGSPLLNPNKILRSPSGSFSRSVHSLAFKKLLSGLVTTTLAKR